MSPETTRTATANPLAQFAASVPEGISGWISVAARGAGAALALYIAFDQSYDRTQIICGVIVAVVLATLPPITRMAAFVAGLGAGILFFSGALLWAQTAGVGMLALGAIAVAATLIDTHQRDGDIGQPIGAFLFGLGATVAVVVVIILTVEG